METIAEQKHEQAEVREFSLKEVCDIFSTIMCFNETGGRDEDGSFVDLEEQINKAICIEHDAKKVTDIVEHIEMIGIHNVAETLDYYHKFQKH